MTDTEVYETMIAWISDATGLTAIKAHQSASRPALPYLMANLTTNREVRDHEQDVTYGEENEAGEITASTSIETEWQLSLHCYGENATQPLNKLRNLYRLPTAQTAIDPLVIHDIGPINRVPELIQKKWEERAQCNLFVRGVASESIDIDTIEETPINFT